MLLQGRAPRVLDIGCGTGIAARLLRDRGCEVLGVEPDERMAAFARRSGLRVEVACFEEWERGDRRFELAISAQAWHWIDPDLGAHRAAEALAPGGMLALFWNFGSPEPGTAAELDDLYTRLAPGCDRYAVLLGASDDRGHDAALAIARSRRFLDPRVTSFHWTQEYSAAEWLDQLRTHSDHATMDPEARERLLGAVAEVLAAHGGRLRVAYETRLVTATLG